MASADRCDCPTYDLKKIQDLVKVGIYSISMSAQADVRALALTQWDVKRCVCSLGAGDFHKTMEAENPSARERGLWQDVYRVRYKHFVLYVKLQHPLGGRPVVISFKEK